RPTTVRQKTIKAGSEDNRPRAGGVLGPPRRSRGSGRHGDFHDLIAQRAARHLDLDLLANLLAEQALAARAGGEDLVVVVILVAGSDQLVDLVLAGVEVLDADAGAEDDGVLGQAALIDDVGAGELVLQRVDARLQHALVLAGGVILGVLAEIPQVTGRRDPLGHLEHLAVGHAVEVGLELLVAFAGHGDSGGGHGLFHSFLLTALARRVLPPVRENATKSSFGGRDRPESHPQKESPGGAAAPSRFQELSWLAIRAL